MDGRIERRGRAQALLNVQGGAIITEAMITTEALAGRLSDPRCVILDASWYMKAETRDAQAEYAAGHIPGAFFFDIDVLSDRTSPYPHMLPSEAAFAKAVSAFGIGADTDVVVYDGNGLFSAARAWWMFRVFGHENVQVLEGGMPKWQAEGRVVSRAVPKALSADFEPRLVPGRVMAWKALQAALKQGAQVIDARSPARFDGAEPEPRPGLPSGHIPGSVNLWYRECLNSPFNTLKNEQELRALLHQRNISPSGRNVASCGSGVTACIVALAFHRLGYDLPVYDGSWTEWGSRRDSL